MTAVASPDDTPTVEIALEPVPSPEQINFELDLWRARLVRARVGIGPYTVENCRRAIDAWLDRKLDTVR